MKESKGSEFIIGIGLDDQEQTRIKEGSDTQIDLINIENKNDLSETQPGKTDPLMAIIPWKVWKNLPRQNPEDHKNGDKKFLLIESREQFSELPDADFIAQCFIAVTSSENTTREINEVLNQTRSYKGSNEKLNKMSKEIELERELLLRKNSQLEFLNTLLGNCHKYLEIDRILGQIKEDLQSIIRVEHCHAIFWSTEGLNANKATIYLSENISVQERTKWINFLLNQKDQQDLQENNYKISNLIDPQKDTADFDPEHILTYPLSMYNQTFGALVIQTPDAYSLGRDKNEILGLGINHLTQVFYNALQFAIIREQAKYDCLTQLNNRQRFDEKLKEEINRHQRHKQELGLLMLDIDHFKEINDNFGHQAGDTVLRELSTILANNVRESDFIARYGGEEFAVILPQTDCEQGKVLAERIRKKVQDTVFRHQGLDLNISVSLGVTSLMPQTPNNHYYLVYLADEALYAAKNKGRNTISSIDPKKKLTTRNNEPMEQKGLHNTAN